MQIAPTMTEPGTDEFNQLVAEIIAHPETFGYHEESGHKDQLETSLRFLSLEQLREMKANADKKLAQAQ